MNIISCSTSYLHILCHRLVGGDDRIKVPEPLPEPVDPAPLPDPEPAPLPDPEPAPLQSSPKREKKETVSTPPRAAVSDLGLVKSPEGLLRSRRVQAQKENADKPARGRRKA